jgi:transposase
MNPRQPYPTDLSDKAWDVIKPLVPDAKPGGRPEAYPKREILNAIFYLLRSGCSWRMLPPDLPPWRIVYHDFRQWRLDGTWQLMHDLLRGDVRAASGKQRQPSAGVIDSQSVQTTEKGGSVATMLASRSRDASVISLSIPSGCSSAWSSRLLVCKTPTGLCRCWMGCGITAPVCAGCGPTRPIAETWAPGFGDYAPGGKFAWRSSNGLRAPQDASFSPNAGLLSGPARGWPATAVYPKIMNT